MELRCIIEGNVYIKLSIIGVLLLTDAFFWAIWAIGETNREKSIGPRTDPCGTPVVQVVVVERE